MSEPKNRTFEAGELPVLTLKPAARSQVKPGSDAKQPRVSADTAAIQPEQREEVVNRVIDRLKRI